MVVIPELLPVLTKLFCLLSFLAHCLVNIWQDYGEDRVLVRENAVNLSSITFPLIFYISLSPGIQLARLEKLGFDNIIYYYYGKNRYNQDIHGWDGRYGNGSIANNSIGQYT